MDENWVKLNQLTSYCPSVVFWFVTDVGSIISKAGVPNVDSTFVAEIQISCDKIYPKYHKNAYLQRLCFVQSYRIAHHEQCNRWRLNKRRLSAWFFLENKCKFNFTSPKIDNFISCFFLSIFLGEFSKFPCDRLECSTQTANAEIQQND